LIYLCHPQMARLENNMAQWYGGGASSNKRRFLCRAASSESRSYSDWTELATVFLRLGRRLAVRVAHIAMRDNEYVNRCQWMSREKLAGFAGHHQLDSRSQLNRTRDSYWLRTRWMARLADGAGSCFICLPCSSSGIGCCLCSLPNRSST